MALIAGIVCWVKLCLRAKAAQSRAAGASQNSGARNVRVKAGGDLQRPSTRRNAGDTLILEGSNLPWPNHVPIKEQARHGRRYITIESSALSGLPEGTRVRPANAALMPRLTTRNYPGRGLRPAWD